MINLFKVTVQGNKSSALGDLLIYYGTNVSDVKSQSAQTVLFGFSSWILLKEEHSFSPFNLSCIGFSSTKPITVHFRIRGKSLFLLLLIIC